MNLNTSKTGPEADLVNIKSRGYLTHPNNKIFKIFKLLELSFTKFADAHNVFEDASEFFFKSKYNLIFHVLNIEQMY